MQRPARIALALIAVSALGFAHAPAAAAPEPEPKGLVGSWTFDEARGLIVPDASGQANDAMVRAGTLVKGVNSTGLQLDGATTSVRVAPSPSLSATEALTLEAWVKLHSQRFEAFPAVVRKDGAYALRFSKGRLGFILWLGGKIVYLNSARADWPTGQWLHLAASYDGARMRLFVDGVEDGNSPQAQTGRIDESASFLGIGSVGSQYRLHGVMDEVRVYSRALSPLEIKESLTRGRQSLRAQKDVAIKPQEIGDRGPVLKKPKREFAMVADGFLWIDAEDFTDYGGWLLDTQFVHLMGSAYLIAAGIGTPVNDATVDVNVPKAGTYRVWVRAKNWLKGHAPGQFRVLVGGVPSQQVFGATDTEKWTWQPAGDFALKKGSTRIALRDRTGYYGRCDALVLTTDPAYTPPAKVEAIAKERSRLTGLDLTPRLVGDFDVIVVGAGSAGSTAALAAARAGARTALIQNRPVLGGNASIELGVPINGAGSSKPNARESGIIEEVGRIKARYGYPKMSEPFRLAAQGEKNLIVFLNRHVFAAEVSDKKTVAAVRAVDTLTNEITRYTAKVFLDCSGDGWLGFFAGAKYRVGREARGELNESLAPEKADHITMSGCLMGRALSFRAQDTGKPTKYVPPPWAAKLPKGEALHRRPRHFAGGQWWLEHEGTIDDIYDAEKARDELIRISFGYWNWIKNESPFRQKAANYAIFHVPIVEAKRESRRLIGDHVLTQNDVQAATLFPDRISYGGWPIDVHHPRGIYSGEEGPFHCNPSTPLYSIPFRCLYSVNIDNLLFAGRCMSVSHIALGTVRVQGTLAAIGQAAGTAAALCVQKGVTPRQLGQKHIAELQQTLVKHDLYIPGITNDDPLDLARKAKLSASSTARYEAFDRSKFRRVRHSSIHPLNTPRAMMFPRGLKTRLEAISLLLSSENEQPTELTLHLREAPASGDFSATTDLATATATIQPKSRGWVEFKLDAAIAAPFAWVWLPPTEGISWHRMGNAPLGSARAYGGDGHWTVVKGQYYAVFTKPGLAIPADYRVENVTNGVTRIIDEATNLWASDPEQPMPQWLQLAFDQPTRLNAVYLTFDTDMNAPFHTVPLVPECVRDYELSVHDGAKWVTVATVKGNFQRRRVHRFPAVAATRVRLTIHATNGSRSARVFEIRAYNE